MDEVDRISDSFVMEKQYRTYEKNATPMKQ